MQALVHRPLEETNQCKLEFLFEDGSIKGMEVNAGSRVRGIRKREMRPTAVHIVLEPDTFVDEHIFKEFIYKELSPAMKQGCYQNITWEIKGEMYRMKEIGCR